MSAETELVDAALRAVGMPFVGGGMVAKRRILHAKIKAMEGAKDICTVCQAPIPSVVSTAVTACPFCGAPFDDGAQVDDAPVMRPSEDEDDPDVADDERAEFGATKAPDAEEETPQATPDRVAAALGISEDEAEDLLSPDAGGEFPREPTTDAAAESPAQEAGQMQAQQQKNGGTKAIAKVAKAAEPAGKVTMYKRSDLETRTRKILELKASYSTNAYALGKLLQETRDSGMWEVGGHKSFNAFCEAECKIQGPWADKIIRAIGEYSAQQFEAIGETNAVRLLSLPESDRKRYVAKLLDAPMTKRELDQAIAKDPVIPKARAGVGGRQRVRVDLSELLGRNFVVTMKGGKGEVKLPGPFVLRLASSPKLDKVTVTVGKK